MVSKATETTGVRLENIDMSVLHVCVHVVGICGLVGAPCIVFTGTYVFNSDLSMWNTAMVTNFKVGALHLANDTKPLDI